MVILAKAYIELKKSFKPKTGFFGGKPSPDQVKQQLLVARSALLEKAHQYLVKNDQETLREKTGIILKKWRTNKPLRSEKARLREGKTHLREEKVVEKEAQKRIEIEKRREMERKQAQNEKLLNSLKEDIKKSMELFIVQASVNEDIANNM